jgi:hypothetical protein
MFITHRYINLYLHLVVKYHHHTEGYLDFTFCAAILFIIKLYKTETSLTELPYLPKFLSRELAEYYIEHAIRKSNVASSRLTFMHCLI